MSTFEIITLEELTDKIELEPTDGKFRICAEFLLSALNDWPTIGLEEPKDLMDELKREINRPLTFENLTIYSSRLGFNVSKNAWKMESMTSVLRMFDFDKELTLDKIIEGLTNHFKPLCKG